MLINVYSQALPVTYIRTRTKQLEWAQGVYLRVDNRVNLSKNHHMEATDIRDKQLVTSLLHISHSETILRFFVATSCMRMMLVQ